MRVILQVTFPHEQFNAAVKDGTAGEKIGRILEALKPEAAYFTEYGGQRTGIIVVNFSDVSKIPTFAEPWFLTFQADVKLRIAMTPADLKKAGLDKLGQMWA